MPLGKTDITFRQSRTYANPTAATGEYVVNIAQRIFHMRKGEDEYSPGMGLDIQSRANSLAEERTRDTEYETEIVNQFNRYTDLVPTMVLCTFLKRTLIVIMEVRHQNTIYRLQVTSEPNTLASIIQNS